MHFGDHKTKSILSASKRRAKSICKLNTRYKEINIKQQAQVTYLKCMLDKSMFGEPMALKVLNKISGKLKFLYKKNKILTLELCKILCNALFRSHFDYACPACYSNFTKKTNKPTNKKIMQNKCIRFCLRLNKMHHISLK